MRKLIPVFIFLSFFSVSSAAFSAGADEKPMTNKQEITTVMKRGWANLFTFPGEAVRTVQAEKSMHPNSWLITYTPKVFFNTVVRVTSSANDIAILPWYVWATNDTRPITRVYDLPDYVWQKD